MSYITKFIIKVKTLDEKSKKLLLNSVLSFAVKGGSIVISVFTLPAYMRYFDNNTILGLWFTAISVLSWILTFDLGIGNGLRNHIVEPIINKDTDRIKRYISSAYVMVGAVVLVGLILGCFIAPFIQWNIVFNVSEEIISSEILLEVVRLLFIGIMLQFLLRLISSIFYAMQKSAVPSFLVLISNGLLLVFVLSAKTSDLVTNLRMLSIMQIISVNLPLLIASVFVFSTSLKKCAPNISFYNKTYALEVMKLGGIFFWLQIMTMLIFNINEFLISWFVAPDNVVIYQIYNKLFGMIGIVYNLALTPVWSAVTEASTKQDYGWIKRLYKKVEQMALIAIIAQFILVFLSQPIINFWLGSKAIIVDYRCASAIVFSGSIHIFMSGNASIFAGLGRLKSTFIFMTLGAFLNFPLAWIFTSMTNSWIGIVLANIVAMLPYIIIQPIILKKYLNKKEREVVKV